MAWGQGTQHMSKDKLELQVPIFVPLKLCLNMQAELLLGYQEVINKK